MRKVEMPAEPGFCHLTGISSKPAHNSGPRVGLNIFCPIPAHSLSTKNTHSDEAQAQLPENTSIAFLARLMLKMIT
jgi:hypothetical protein